jgi:site-specific recombinase XerD
MGSAEVERFLTHLATDHHVSPATHRQALSALLYLYREVLDVDLPWMEELDRPAMRNRIPAVLTVDEVRRRLGAMENAGEAPGDARLRRREAST